MESPWEISETINNRCNFPAGRCTAWCLKGYFSMWNQIKQQYLSALLYRNLPSALGLIIIFAVVYDPFKVF